MAQPYQILSLTDDCVVQVFPIISDLRLRLFRTFSHILLRVPFLLTRRRGRTFDKPNSSLHFFRLFVFGHILPFAPKLSETLLQEIVLATESRFTQFRSEM